MDLENFLEKVLDAMTAITERHLQGQIGLEGRVKALQSDYVGDLGALEKRLEYLEGRNDFHLAVARKNAKKHVDLTALAARVEEVQAENNRLSVLYVHMAKKYASLTGRSHYLPEVQEAEKTESLAVKNQGVQELSQHIDKFFWQKLQGVEDKEGLVTLICEASHDYVRRYMDKGADPDDTFDRWTIREVALLYIKWVLTPKVVENCAGTKERNYEAHPTYSIRENGEYWRGDKGRRLSYSTRDRAQARIERNNGHN
jgi:hypothetical protein